MPYSSYGYTFNSIDTEALQALIPLFVFLFVILALVFILGIVSYILRGIAIYRMSEARKLEYGWLGFIPIASRYQLGAVAGEIQLGDKKIKNPGIWLLLAPIVYGIVFAIGYMIIMVPYIVKMVMLGDNATPEEVMGPLVAFMFAIFIFVLVMVVAQVFVYLFKYLALHKIFSAYSLGQKPVYYMIIAMFIPLAEPILLYIHSSRPMLQEVEEKPPYPGF